MKLYKSKNKVLILLLVLVAGILTVYLYKLLKSDLIYKGVKIDKFDVSSMPKEEALNFLKAHKEKDKYSSIKLAYYDRIFKIPLDHIAFEYDYVKAVNQAYSLGRTGNMPTRLYELLRIRFKGEEIPLEIIYDRNKLEDIVEKISMEVGVEAKDAEIYINDGNIEIVNEVVGKKVKKADLLKAIEKSLYKHELDVINIPVENTIPKVTSDL